MVEPNRPPPSAEELAELQDAFRRDPARAFVYLGDALIALGRPREAIEVGARGLKVDPDNMLGRVMVARAFASLHQWKEAQAELLKVVKSDRNHAPGFRMLGEVLMRRADYERALPVLQHAQNLDPADPGTLALLRRARASQSLDPPPPIPTPIQPAAGRRGGPGARAMPIDQEYVPQEEILSSVSTRVAGEIETQSGPTHADAGARGRPPVHQGFPPPHSPEPPGMMHGRMPLPPEPPGGRGRASQPPPMGMPPAGMPPTHAMSPVGAGANMMHQTIPPGGVAVRPRVMPLEKPRDAAQASLRQSAAVGEHYLNNLLVAGLLDVPRVRVPDASYDVGPGRRWGRSTLRMFIYLFILLFMGLGGAGAWYWYADQQRTEDVARHIEGARGIVDSGEHDALARADEETRAAIERDRDNTEAVALLAHITALESFLYGELNPADISNAIDLAAQDVTAPTASGFRELTLARASYALATVATMEEGGDARVADARRGLETWLEAHGEDGLARWLYGHTLWAAGDRKGAAVAFEQADKGGEGPVLATIALADMRLDDGKYEEAKALYDRALGRSPKHAWGFVGRSLTRSERSVEIAEAVADLNVGVATKNGPRIDAYKHLALATAQLGQEDYKSFAAELDLATDVADPRFLARVALLRVQQGKLAEAAKLRADIRWYADKPQPDPLVVALDAELRLASGAAREALAGVENEEGLRAARLRGRALFDLGKADKARAELDEAVAIAPKDIELAVWAEAARLVATTGDDRRKADEALDSLGRQAKSKSARVLHGIALAAVGRRPDARDKLEQSLTDVTDEYPNPLAYRAHVALAEIDLVEGKVDAAVTNVEKALALNNGYLPAHDLMGRLLVERSPDEARRHLLEVINAGAASIGAELAFARLLVASGTADDRKAAAEALRRAKAAGATPEQLAPVLTLLADPAIAAELGVAGAAPSPRAPAPKRRRHR